MTDGQCSVDALRLSSFVLHHRLENHICIETMTRDKRMKTVGDTRSSDSPFIETIWRTQTEQAGHFTSLAASHSEIVVTRYEGKTTISIRGPETKATTAFVPAGGEFFGIVF